MSIIELFLVSTSITHCEYVLLLNFKCTFWVFTFPAQNVFLDEPVQKKQLLKSKESTYLSRSFAKLSGVCEPLIIVSCSQLAPTSAQKYLMIDAGGTRNAFATSCKLVMFVLTPLSRDSYFSTILGMVYLNKSTFNSEQFNVKLPVTWICYC